MTPRGVMTATVLLCLILGLLSQAPAALGARGRIGCCTTYHRQPIPFENIKGFREQTMMRNCHIEAIVFYTVKRTEICATRKDEWVKAILKSLSAKLKKLSKASPAAGVTHMKKSNDGSGSVFTTTESFQNSTDSYY